MTSTPLKSLDENLATGSQDARFFEIREADDGFSLFTWADHGGTVGVIQWHENHELDWEDAHRAALAWLKHEQLPVGTSRPRNRREKALHGE